MLRVCERTDCVQENHVFIKVQVIIEIEVCVPDFPSKDPQIGHLHRKVVAQIQRSEYHFRLPYLNQDHGQQSRSHWSFHR